MKSKVFQCVSCWLVPAALVVVSLCSGCSETKQPPAVTVKPAPKPSSIIEIAGSGEASVIGFTHRSGVSALVDGLAGSVESTKTGDFKIVLKATFESASEFKFKCEGDSTIIISAFNRDDKLYRATLIRATKGCVIDVSNINDISWPPQHVSVSGDGEVFVGGCNGVTVTGPVHVTAEKIGDLIVRADAKVDVDDCANIYAWDWAEVKARNCKGTAHANENSSIELNGNRRTTFSHSGNVKIVMEN